jgi:hypothetical protein
MVAALSIWLLLVVAVVALANHVVVEVLAVCWRTQHHFRRAQLLLSLELVELALALRCPPPAFREVIVSFQHLRR